MLFRSYICWVALKRGFLEGCRPLIEVDGCHLKGPYKGILLTAAKEVKEIVHVEQFPSSPQTHKLSPNSMMWREKEVYWQSGLTERSSSPATRSLDADFSQSL